MGIHGQLTANLKLLVRILGTKKQRSVANPQPTRKPANLQTRSQSTTIGPHFGHKKMGIHGIPAANPQSTHNYWSVFWTQKNGDPWPTHSQPETIGPHFGHKKAEICGQPAANPQTRKPANPQPIHNYWSAFWTQKNGNPWQTRSQPETIGLHFGHKKAEIRGQPAANPQTRSQPATNPQLLVRILELRKWCGAVGNMTHHPSANESNFYHKKCGPTVLQMVWQWRIGCISTLLSRKNADLELRKWCGAVRNMTHHPPTNEYDFYCKKMRT
jgi:hypothetical protein